jgi:hypothetical protein
MRESYFCLPFQIYMGTSRATVVQNQDIVKQLQVDMLIATTSSVKFPKIGRVIDIPPNLSMASTITVHWMKQEQATHKPKWLRFFTPSGKKNAVGTTTCKDILLYGFELTKKGALKKKSREYLQANMD